MQYICSIVSISVALSREKDEVFDKRQSVIKMCRKVKTFV